ncbi:MAG: menaquinone biosynthesis protein [Acidobacteriaceae bacterium]|nr:menaquinone biosynthesis protein [Acidobacteriaceae bacterium]MBV9037187.1 menaquinone biosynthesis protein [Acidobacteriaceae bacterium]MBV9223446.1 menaquinone biosynthesis protein [Acidobacteriaceae bacterium]
MRQNDPKVRVGAVSYLNTVPLVWGMLHGKEREVVDLGFSLPAVCAEQVEKGLIDVGLVPVAEIARQQLQIVSDVGIACYGAVRSILLASRVPFRRIRTLAADAGSRTSVQLAKVILRERYGVEPQVYQHTPELNAMLKNADAALIIGDPALQVEPQELSYEWLDLGSEWLTLTNLPMVFAAWAGKPGIPAGFLSQLKRNSYEFGKAHLDDIIEGEYRKRSITRELAKRYLTEFIRFDLGQSEQNGLEAFLELAHLHRPTWHRDILKGAA